MGTDAHRAAAARAGPVTVGIVTVSDTRTADDDPNGAYLHERIAAAGAVVAGYRVVRDEPDEVRAAVDELVARRASSSSTAARASPAATRPTTRWPRCSRSSCRASASSSGC